ncbi:MAG: glycerophosphodiester phosphodiesterase [Rhizobiaceae bacterium]
MKRVVDLVIRAVIVFALAYVGAAAVLRFVLYPGSPRPDIAHGGGAARDGTVRTNSLESIMLSNASGFEAIEIDISRTSDGRFVCGHDWQAFGNSAPDFETFLRDRDAIRHRPCVAKELIAWFQLHPGPDLYVDVKQDAVQGSALFAAALGRRVIADAVTPEAVCALREAGVDRVAFSTYARPSSWSGLKTDLQHPCVAQAEAISIPIERTLLGHAFLAKALTGLPVYVHTADGCFSTRVAWFFGADGVFTDAAAPDSC